MNQELCVNNKTFLLNEIVEYPNGASTYFYVFENEVIIIDDSIWDNNNWFPYSLITEKQNHYVYKYDKVYRYLKEDIHYIETSIQKSEQSLIRRTFDREESLDASPLEFKFEENFTKVYGMSALKYLSKEYGITDYWGNNYYLDYYIRTLDGDIAVEENGVIYHHPQFIGKERYRKQLQKQNTCTAWGIKLYRFSSEDIQFAERIEDDIKTFFGNTTERFIEKGILAERTFKLYEHQENTLEEIKNQREKGIRTFLVVFPTASGKSKIIEEDMKAFSKDCSNFSALILAPNTNIIEDWKNRIHTSLPELENRIEVRSYSHIMRNYQYYNQNKYSYIVIDEAHHAVAPVLKRVIQYFTPEFLIGLTATDQRPDKQKLETIFGSYTTGLSLIDAMKKNIIAQANVFRIETNLDLSKVRFNGKDYINADLEKGIRVTSRNQLIADVLEQYFDHSSLQGIIFCVNTEHALEMEKVLNKRGLNARSYTSRTKDKDIVMSNFKKKHIRFLCSCNMISEGWDYPELGILVMARPTLSKVLYLQQIGRGLRKTETKKNVYVIDVVDEYGAMARPCTMHSIFSNAMYVPFGNILRSNYSVNDMVIVDGLEERIERIVEVDIENFEDKYGNYLSQEQLARELFVSTSSVINWIKKGKVTPGVSIPFGNKKIYLFAPEQVEQIREENHLSKHSDETMKEDFFHFLEERDYSLSYKMPFLLSFLKHMNSIGDANIDSVLDDYIDFYMDRINRGLPVDRKTCPYNRETLKDRKLIKKNMLTNPFEKFERKRFLYYSKDLNMISLNHILLSKLTKSDYDRIRKQMKEDLENYYSNL